MAVPIPTLINGKAYEWADAVINILGVPIAGIVAFEYEDRQEMENIYGAGNRAVARAYGNFRPTAKVTISMEELEPIQAVAPGGVLQRIPEFDITAAFIDDALVPRVHTVKNCRFMNNGRKSQQGETSINIELDIICSHINFT